MQEQDEMYILHSKCKSYIILLKKSIIKLGTFVMHSIEIQISKKLAMSYLVLISFKVMNVCTLS